MHCILNLVHIDLIIAMAFLKAKNFFVGSLISTSGSVKVSPDGKECSSFVLVTLVKVIVASSD